MKRIASIVCWVTLFAPSACKHKDNTPPSAASASVAAPLSTGNGLPSADRATPTGGEFEGEIGLLAKGKLAADDAAPLSLTLRIKNGKLRIDLPESFTRARDLGPAYLLVQPADKKAYAVLEAKKQAVLLELDKLAEQAKVFGGRARAMGAKGAPSAAPHLEKTGKVDTVAGTPCEIWRFNQGNDAGEACIAEQATPWLRLPVGPEAPAELSWISELADGRHLPLRFVSLENGVERGRVEVTSIQPKALQGSLFEVPADYAISNLEQMMGSMLGGLNGSGMPPGFKLPPGMKLPPGVQLPPGVLPPSGKSPSGR